MTKQENSTSIITKDDDPGGERSSVTDKDSGLLTKTVEDILDVTRIEDREVKNTDLESLTKKKQKKW